MGFGPPATANHCLASFVGAPHKECTPRIGQEAASDCCNACQVARGGQQIIPAIKPCLATADQWANASDEERSEGEAFQIISSPTASSSTPDSTKDVDSNENNKILLRFAGKDVQDNAWNVKRSAVARSRDFLPPQMMQQAMRMRSNSWYSNHMISTTRNRG